MKRILGLVLLLILLVTGSALTMAAEQAVKVYVDGVEISFPDQKAIINTDNRTLVPVRFVSQALGAKVDWDGVNQLVNIKHGQQEISLCIGCHKATLNSGQVILDTRASIIGSRTMVPLRFVSECLQAKVDWKGAERAVYITTVGSIAEDSDEALITSDLILNTIQPGNPNKIDLSVLVDYGWHKPVEPQLADLKKLLEKRFGDKAQEIIDYVALKTDDNRILPKDWAINGKIINVFDNGTSVSIRVRS